MVGRLFYTHNWNMLIGKKSNDNAQLFSLQLNVLPSTSTFLVISPKWCWVSPAWHLSPMLGFMLGYVVINMLDKVYRLGDELTSSWPGPDTLRSVSGRISLIRWVLNYSVSLALSKMSTPRLGRKMSVVSGRIGTAICALAVIFHVSHITA